MKIKVMSDLHLEMDHTYLPENNGADVLVLSGDICLARPFSVSVASPYYKMFEKFFEFFAHCSDNFNHVVYVKGNHEHYNARFNDVTAILKNGLKCFNNVHVLDNETVTLDDVLFLGTTLWTDLNKGCPITEMTLKNGMNDYRVVQYKDRETYRKLQPFDTAKFHSAAKVFLKETLLNYDGKAVVCAHHAPSKMSVNEKYSDDHYFNGGYYSDMYDFIADLPQVKLFTHGHMHDAVQYNIEGTRVVCNPRGYPGQKTGFDPDILVEV